MYDLAREQAPTLDHLMGLAAVSLDAGYDGIGLYLEHRFAYPGLPWARGTQALTPDTVRRVRSEFPSLQVVPFVNLLSHVEGFLYSQGGQGLREGAGHGMQACPSRPETTAFAQKVLDDTLAVFDSEIVHIGGDETWQLGDCPECRARAEASTEDGKADLFAAHYAPLAQRVVAAGRRPAVWGDMILAHPAAGAAFPKETLIFDWQYFGGVAETAPRLAAHGHEVVACPTLHVYDAAWMHTGPSEENVRRVSRDALDLGLAGVCLTTWEAGLFGAYDTVLPAVAWARTAMDDPDGAPSMLEAYGESAEWARLMGEGLAELGGVFAHDGHRSRLKSRFLLFADPFSLWRHHGAELAGEAGRAAVALCEKAAFFATDEAQRGVTAFVRGAVEFCQLTDRAAVHYAEGRPEKALAALAPLRHLFDTLERVARDTHRRIGGSLADGERCGRARERLEEVMRRVQKYGRGELGYLPAFDVLTHPRWVPYDQACWWLVNRWGCE